MLRKRVDELKKRDAQKLETCGYAEFFKPVAPVFLAVTNVLRQLGINGILDDQTVADRDAVDKLNSMITAAAQRRRSDIFTDK